MSLAPFPQQVTLDSSGAGTVRIQNNNVAAVWIVRQVTVRTNPATPGAIANLFQGVNFVCTLYFAGQGDTAGGEPPLFLDPGEYVDAVFTGGPASGQAVMTLYYDEVPR